MIVGPAELYSGIQLVRTLIEIIEKGAAGELSVEQYQEQMRVASANVASGDARWEAAAKPGDKGEQA